MPKTTAESESAKRLVLSTKSISLSKTILLTGALLVTDHSGIEKTKYNVWGLDEKPKTRIDDVMEMSSEDLNRKWSYIYNNIMDFKLINNIK